MPLPWGSVTWAFLMEFAPPPSSAIYIPHRFYIITSCTSSKVIQTFFQLCRSCYGQLSPPLLEECWRVLQYVSDVNYREIRTGLTSVLFQRLEDALIWLPAYLAHEDLHADTNGPGSWGHVFLACITAPHLFPQSLLFDLENLESVEDVAAAWSFCRTTSQLENKWVELLAIPDRWGPMLMVTKEKCVCVCLSLLNGLDPPQSIAEAFKKGPETFKWGFTKNVGKLLIQIDSV